VIFLSAAEARQESKVMCDDFTDLAGDAVTRREFAAMGALAALVACSGAS